MNRAYHRNGVCGTQFRVAVTTDKSGRPHRLIVKFRGQPVRVKLNTLVRDMFKAKPLGKYRNPWAQMSGKVYAIASTGLPDCPKIVAYTDGKQRFVGVKVPDPDDGTVAFAAICLDLLPDVTFGINSWRGDHHAAAIRSYLEAHG